MNAPYSHRRPWLALSAVALAFVAGCASDSAEVAAIPSTQSATDINPLSAEPSYWLARPGTATVADADFDRLWNAAGRVSRDLLFTIDREDRRSGLLTTAPSISPQWFEPWRRELQTADDLAESSVATIRRTLYFSFERRGDEYIVTPKVLVERQAIAERRVSGQLTRTYFRNDPRAGISGSRSIDAGVLLPDSYWYALGRDENLEQELARRLRAELGRPA